MLQSHINQSFIKYKSGNKERYFSFLFKIVHHWRYIIYLCLCYFKLDAIYAKNTTCNFEIVSMERESWNFNEHSPLDMLLKLGSQEKGSYSQISVPHNGLGSEPDWAALWQK